MIQNTEYWSSKIRELRIAIAKTDNPTVLKNYEDLIWDYEKMIHAATAYKAASSPPVAGPGN